MAALGAPPSSVYCRAPPLRRWGRQSMSEADARALHDADVVFLPSFTEEERWFLLRYAHALVYTPSNEVGDRVAGRPLDARIS